MAIGVQVWSLTPASNATADTNINYAEGMAPSALNDSNRSLMSSVAKWRDDNNGTVVTSGTSAAFTAVTNQIEGALTAGFTVALQFHATNDTSATLAVDSLTAKPLQIYAGKGLIGGEYQTGGIGKFTYSTTGTGQWIAQGYALPTSASTNNILQSTSTADLALSVTLTSLAFVTNATTGVWLATGVMTMGGATGAPLITARLTDGTSPSPTLGQGQAASNLATITATWLFSNPAGNIRLQAANNSASGGTASGSVVAVRLA